MLETIKTRMKSSHINYVAKQHKFVFTHIPKCAGSALSKSLLKGLYPSYIRNSPLTAGIDIEQAREISQTLAFDEQKVREIFLASFLESKKKVFITGHCYANPDLVSKYCNNWNFITILRDPVDRFVSEYVYNTFKKEKWKNNSLPFEEYIEGKEAKSSGTTYARFFSGMSNFDIIDSPDLAIERSVNNLKKFYKVGFLNNINNWVNELNHEFNGKIKIERSNNSPNVLMSKQIINSEASVKAIQKLCEIDIEIYKILSTNIKKL